jgi:hypothetical protein
MKTSASTSDSVVGEVPSHRMTSVRQQVVPPAAGTPPATGIAPSRARGGLLNLFAVAAVLILSALASPSAGAQPFRVDPPLANTPAWSVDPAFKHDVFTFARVRYSSYSEGRRRRFRGGFGDGGPRWSTDFPDAELNLSFRLQQMTSLKVNPEPVAIDLTPADLTKHPFIYIVEPGAMILADEEVAALRSYLLNGGFLMVDDFWGEDEWNHFYEQLKRVFPEREPTELPLEHPIFHCVFDLKEKPQVLSIHSAARSRYMGSEIPRERPGDPTAWDVHYRALFDDKGRMMAIICHNTDLGDGWEREGLDETYFREYSEKKAYPIAINIVFYSMTH